MVAFAALRCFGAAVFLEDVVRLAIIFFGALLFTEAFAFAAFRATVFSATALFALGRLVLALSVRLLAVDLGADLWAAARAVERRRPLVTALMEASIERLVWSLNAAKLRRESNIASYLIQREKRFCGHSQSSVPINGT